MVATDVRGKKVAILAADGVERVEYGRPRQALTDACAATDLLSFAEGEIQSRDEHLDLAGTLPVDALVGSASVDDYDALLPPGGTVNPDRLRLHSGAVTFVKEFVESGKPVAAAHPRICRPSARR